MEQADAHHQNQIDYWSGEAGALWRARQDRTDAMLSEILEGALNAAAPKPDETVLDVGCGCGASTLALAQAVAPHGRVMALDVSPPMLERARERAFDMDNIDWRLGDAATIDLPAQSVDLLFSRFGVMFFGDSAAAFKNMRRAMKRDGRLAFVCWRSPEENEWALLPLRAAYKHVPRLGRPGPEEPGPFSFADPARVTRVLTQAGFAPPHFAKLDVALDLAGGEGLEAAVEEAIHVGPASRALADQPEEARNAAIAEMRKALALYEQAGAVKLKGAVWIVTARAS
jgi:SAM-dependent methyltransferase